MRPPGTRSLARRGLRALRGPLVSLAIRFTPRLALLLARLDRRELGLVGEELAARALSEAGWRVLGRRVATPAGEVDLVVRAGDLLAAVEVKAGRVAAGQGSGSESAYRPAGRVDAERLARQRQAARWLAACLGAPSSRVDVVEVLVRGWRARIVHLPDLQEPLEPAPRRPDRAWLPGAPGSGPGDGGPV